MLLPPMSASLVLRIQACTDVPTFSNSRLGWGFSSLFLLPGFVWEPLVGYLLLILCILYCYGGPGLNSAALGKHLK